MTILFSEHHQADLRNFLLDASQWPFITGALMRPVRGEPGQYRCSHKQNSKGLPQQDHEGQRILMCGHCQIGVIRLFDPPTRKAQVPECGKCGARVCGLEIHFQPWHEWRVRQMAREMRQHVEAAASRVVEMEVEG